MHYRQTHAGDFFYGLFHTGTGQVLALINGTLCRGTTLEHDTMSHHDPQGKTLCIHSVVVRPPLRRRGLATAFLQTYVHLILDAYPDRVLRLRLITKAQNLGLYHRCGFRFLRPSPVVHGQEKWFEMGLDRLSLVASEGELGKGLGRAFVHVDAFTGMAFGGNPAAVVFCHGEGCPRPKMAEHSLVHNCLLWSDAFRVFPVTLRSCWFDP